MITYHFNADDPVRDFPADAALGVGRGNEVFHDFFLEDPSMKPQC